jgi:hypothetical protein
MFESLAVQSSGLLGAGNAAARTLGQSDGRDFHYGVAPQALLNLRMIAGRRAALDLTTREYFISDLGGFGTGQRDLIFVGDASLAVRVYRRHALRLTYQLAGRSSDYLELPDRTQSSSRSACFTRSSARAASARCSSHPRAAYSPAARIGTSRFRRSRTGQQVCYHLAQVRVGIVDSEKIGRHFGPRCPACRTGHGLTRLMSLRGNTVSLAYACTSCANEWTILQSAEAAGHDATNFVMQCPACQTGRGVVHGVTIDREARTSTYHCDACSHRWVVHDTRVR